MDELQTKGIKINNIYNTRINSAELQVYSIIDRNWRIGRCLTLEKAKALVNAVVQFTYNKYSIDFHIDINHEYFKPNEIKRLLIQLRLNVSNLNKYSGEAFNLHDKDSDLITTNGITK
jgi:hypothetical protein